MREFDLSRGTPPFAWLVGGALFLSLVAGVIGWRWGVRGREASGDIVDTAAWTEFRLPTLDGRQLGPSDLKGHVVLVEFWATWCSPCHVQAKILAPLYEEFRGQGVEFLAVSLGEEEDTVRAFVEKNPFSYPVLIDPQDSVAVEAGIYALPTVMVIDRHGDIAYLEQGISERPKLRQVLQEAGAS